jgi:uncharacterized membrane protein
MVIIGRFHPLLIHFPIALSFAAAASEVVALATSDERWRTVARVNARMAAGFALMAALAGWVLALEPGMAAGPLLEWHRWFGTVGATLCLAAAIVASPVEAAPPYYMHLYRAVLFATAAVIGAAGHLGGLLVWGIHFLTP